MAGHLEVLEFARMFDRKKYQSVAFAMRLANGKRFHRKRPDKLVLLSRSGKDGQVFLAAEYIRPKVFRLCGGHTSYYQSGGAIHRSRASLAIFCQLDAIAAVPTFPVVDLVTSSISQHDRTYDR